ncbi:hypothetical protein Tco_1306889, partial [Tanacetum coccineum]
HTYVSQLKGPELENLIATYDILLDLRPRLPDPNFRMINLLARDTVIGAHLSASSSRFEQDTLQTGGCFSFAKHRDPAPVCMEGVKSGLKLWKEKFFLIDRRAFPFYMPWRNPDLCITDRVPTSFNQGHVDQLKAHIVILQDISEGVLVRSGLSRVWRNPMCDHVLRHSDNTVMSIYDFLCMPSLDKVMVREEPHGLDTSILGRVADRTTSPAPAGTAIPRASPRGYFHYPTSGDEVEQADDGTLDDDDQHDGSEFAIEDIESLNDVSQDKEVEPHVELSGGVRRATRASFHYAGINEDVSPHDQEVALAPNEEIHGVNLGLHKKELYKDPKIIKKQNDDIRQQSESIDHANEDVSRLMAYLEVLKTRFLKSGEFNRAFAGVLNMAISVGVKRGLHMDRTDKEFRELSQRVDGFILDAKEKLDRSVVAFPTTTFPFLDKLSQNS